MADWQLGHECVTYVSGLFCDLCLRAGPAIQWSHESDSNRRPAVYETAALPTELSWLIKGPYGDASNP